MKRRYFSIIALAFVFGIATLFTSCGSEDEVSEEATDAIEALGEEFGDAIEAIVDTAVVEAAEEVSEEVEAVVEEVTE